MSSSVQVFPLSKETQLTALPGLELSRFICMAVRGGQVFINRLTLVEGLGRRFGVKPFSLQQTSLEVATWSKSESRITSQPRTDAHPSANVSSSYLHFEV